MAQLRLYTFGPPRLERHGQPVDLGLRKALALVVYLAVTGQPHTRDHLATLLWPEADQREARARLRRTLYQLSEALGADTLLAEGDSLRVDPQLDLWVDCAAFQALVTDGLPEAPAQILDPHQVAQLARAADLYTAEFLAGFTLPDSVAFDEWQFFQRESLRHRYGQALEYLARATSAQRHWEQAIGYARRWLALDALHEPAHQLLMRLYAWSGQHAAALRQFQDCNRLLERELGQAPEDETVALYESIRRRQLPHDGADVPAHTNRPPLAALAAPSAAAAHAPHGDASGPQLPTTASVSDFVARQHELAWLEDLLRAALGAQGNVGFVVGEAGQGKTALLRAFAQRSQSAHPDLVALWGSCNAYTGVGDPYLPFREILEQLTGNVHRDPLADQRHDDHTSRLLRVLPVTAQVLVDFGADLIDTLIPARGLLQRAAHAGQTEPWVQQLAALVSSAGRVHGDLRQQGLFEHYARVVQTVAQRVPLLLILDDLQWADRASADLLLHLGRRLKGSRVLIVGAYRPADVAIGRDGQRHVLEPVIGELQRAFGVIRLDLAQADGEPLVDALLDCEPNRLDEAFRAALYRQTGGHPLFTIELLRDMRERGELTRDAEGRWVASPQLHWTSLPARVDGVIGERIGRLDARLREMLRVASVEGEEFTAEVVARVLGADEQEIVRRLSRELDDIHHLVRALHVRRDDGVRLSRYRFQHILIQRYLYHSLDEVQRSYEHEAVGHTLEALYGARADEIAPDLARHFEAAQLPAKAAHYSEQAGDHARRAAAFAEAIRYYQAALQGRPASDAAGRARMLRKLGECWWMLSCLPEAFAAFEACQALYESLGDREGAGATLRLMGRMYWEQGDRARSLEHYHRALALLEQGPESVELARAISSISQMHMLASHYRQAIVWGERALALAERLGADDVVAHALNHLGIAYSGMGDIRRGEGRLRESLRRALDQNLPHDACRAYLNLAELLLRLGRYADARATLEALEPYAMRVDAPLYMGSMLVKLAGLDWLVGRWKEVLARQQEIRERIERSHSITYLEVEASMLFGQIWNDLGQPAAALAVLEQALPKARSQAEFQTTGPYLAQTARALIVLDKEPEAAALVRELLDLLAAEPAIQLNNTLPLVALCRLLNGHPRLGAHDMPETVVAALEHADAQVSSPEAKAVVSEARGALALSQGINVQAVAPFRRAAEGWAALGRPYDQARALMCLGQALRKSGDIGAAREALDLAQHLIETLAAQLDDPDVKAAFLTSWAAP